MTIRQTVFNCFLLPEYRKGILHVSDKSYGHSILLLLVLFTLIVVHCNSQKDFLMSHTQHLSYDVCLEVRWEIIRTVLWCIVY